MYYYVCTCQTGGNSKSLNLLACGPIPVGEPVSSRIDYCPGLLFRYDARRQCQVSVSSKLVGTRRETVEAVVIGYG